MRIKLTLRNDFHQTEVTIAPDLEPAYGRLWSTYPTIRRASRKLCPSPDCTCAESPASGTGLAVLGAFYNRRTGLGCAGTFAHRAEVERILGRKVEG